jgi:Ca-activated chloride channel family protein
MGNTGQQTSIGKAVSRKISAGKALMNFFPAELTFVWPAIFWLLPLPLVIYWLLPARQQQETALRIPTYRTLASIEQQHRHAPSFLKLCLLTLIWLLTVTAAARPQWIGDAVQLPSSGRDLLLAVDISGSMETPDMLINGEQTARITVVKQVVSDFVKRRSGDRLGLILFGTRAYLHVPLTFDRNMVEQLLQEAQLGFAGIDTSIGDAIAIATKRLREKSLHGKTNKQQVVILLTDGKNNAGEIDPKQAAELAKMAGIKIHTIGIGADSMMVRNFFFSQKINPSAELDEKTLTYIAETTGGKYFRARDPKQLEDIYHLIDQIDPTEQDQETFRPVSELFYYPLAIAVLLSFLLSLLFVFLASNITITTSKVSP